MTYINWPEAITYGSSTVRLQIIIASIVGLKYSAHFVLAQKPHIPHCLDCGCLIRPDIVLYEESLDKQVFKTSQKLIAKADVLIIGGTSLSVYPAAGLIDLFNGEKLVLINKENSVQNIHANLILNCSLEDALGYTI